MLDKSEKRSGSSWPYIAGAVITAAMIFVLNAYGRVWWCKSADWAIYINDAWKSSHTSQHFFDPYTFTHILHGIAYFWLTFLIFRRLRQSWRFVISIGAAAAWEMFENSPYVIEKYRANTASLDYLGDSISNSLGDVAAAAAGFWLASLVGKWWSLAIFAAIEITLLFWIRDSLLLNILMLVYPLDGVRQWQMG